MDESFICFNNILYKKLLLKCLSEMSEIVVINDNNNCAPTLFRSLCEIGGDCFDALVFFFGSRRGIFLREDS